MNANNLINNLDTVNLTSEEVERLDTLKAKLNQQEAKWAKIEAEQVKWAPPAPKEKVEEEEAEYVTATKIVKEEVKTFVNGLTKTDKVLALITIIGGMYIALKYGLMIISVFALAVADTSLGIAAWSAPKVASSTPATGSFWSSEPSPSQEVKAKLLAAKMAVDKSYALMKK